MKKIIGLALLCILLSGITVSAREKSKGVPVKNWNSIQTYDVATLHGTLADHMHQVVAIRFNGRGKDLHHRKAGWYETALWQPRAGGAGFIDVKVLVPKKDLNAFKSITTDPQSPEVLTVYGEVLRDYDSKFLFVRLMGRNATPDGKGGAVITW